jgi:tryptophan synthase alpha chain
MTRLSKRMNELKKSGKKGLFIYITAGAPELDTTVETVRRAEKAGADVIELGIPFSDPMADGPVIQKAAVAAIQNGITLKKILGMVKEIRTFSQIPLVGMGYINNILNYGVEKFIEDFKTAGMDGIIIPDLPHEESAFMRKICTEQEFNLIEFVTPNTVAKRVEETCKSANGFIYCVSVNGVTGVQKIDYGPINNVVKMVRQHSNIPLAVGFGIGSVEAALEASEEADAVIVGSAVVRRIMENDKAGAMQLIHDVRTALDERVK